MPAVLQVRDLDALSRNVLETITKNKKKEENVVPALLAATPS